MKKRVVLLMALALVLALFATACGKKAEPIKTGIGFAISQTSSKDATAEKDGTAQTDATVAAVTVDKDGKVVACAIDCAQTKISFGADGLIKTDLKAEFSTKLELKEKYNMKGASPIGKEWYEQAEAFAAYCVGKTAAEIKGLKITDGYLDKSVDLAASVTIHATDFVEAVVNAIEGATDCGAKKGDKLGLAIATNISSSKDATAEKAGNAQAYSTISVLTLDADGKITSSLIDSYQSNIAIDATGKITSDLTAGVKTKNQLKEDYNMKGASPIGKEWYEQAAAYAAFVVGKDKAGVNGIKVEEGYVKEADLAATCTIHVTDFNTAITKAIDNAK